jgi:hypothetical protein
MRIPRIGWIGWALLIGEIAVLLRHHWTRLEPAERTRLTEIVRKSKGRPANLSEGEKLELRELVSKIEPRELAKGMVSTATPLRGRRRG